MRPFAVRLAFVDSLFTFKAVRDVAHEIFKLFSLHEDVPLCGRYIFRGSVRPLQWHVGTRRLFEIVNKAQTDRHHGQLRPLGVFDSIINEAVTSAVDFDADEVLVPSVDYAAAERRVGCFLKWLLTSMLKASNEDYKRDLLLQRRGSTQNSAHARDVAGDAVCIVSVRLLALVAGDDFPLDAQSLLGVLDDVPTVSNAVQIKYGSMYPALVIKVDAQCRVAIETFLSTLLQNDRIPEYDLATGPPATAWITVHPSSPFDLSWQRTAVSFLAKDEELPVADEDAAGRQRRFLLWLLESGLVKSAQVTTKLDDLEMWMATYEFSSCVCITERLLKKFSPLPAAGLAGVFGLSEGTLPMEECPVAGGGAERAVVINRDVFLNSASVRQAREALAMQGLDRGKFIAWDNAFLQHKRLLDLPSV